MRILLAVVLGLSCNAVAQGIQQLATINSGVVIAKLSPPSYPPLALQARITGTVELNVTIRRDGSIESVTVVSGHPILSEAALDSARHTEWECKGCGEAAITHRFEYKFEHGEPLPCTRWGTVANGDPIYDKPAVHVRQSGDTITVIDSPVPICDPAGERRKARSPKCLYLWRCGVREVERSRDWR
jgi:TonB family protein